MGLWLARIKLETGEVIRWESLAARAVNRWITSGGQLVVTDKRVLFQPNRIDAATGKKPWECPLESIVDIELIGRDPTAVAGGLRRRLEIKTFSSVEIFVVNNLEKKVVELRELLPIRRDSA